MDDHKETAYSRQARRGALTDSQLHSRTHSGCDDTHKICANDTRRNSYTARRGEHNIIPTAEELLAVGGCWECSPWQNDHTLVEGCTSKNI